MCPSAQIENRCLFVSIRLDAKRQQCIQLGDECLELRFKYSQSFGYIC